jgi:sugar lactone lactonase YvrE
VQTLREGLDGLQITPDGSRMYYSPLTSDYLYSIPTANLLARLEDSALVEIEAANNVTNHGQRGGNANGFEVPKLPPPFSLHPR